MFTIFTIFIVLILPSSAFSFEAKKSIDVGLLISPSFTPEGGYGKSNIRFGTDIGVSFFKYENLLTKFGSIDGIVTSGNTTFKLLRVGVGVVEDRPVITFSPIQVRFADKIYLSPSFAFGRSPYTIFSISYDFTE